MTGAATAATKASSNSGSTARDRGPGRPPLRTHRDPPFWRKARSSRTGSICAAVPGWSMAWSTHSAYVVAHGRTALIAVLLMVHRATPVAIALGQVPPGHPVASFHKIPFRTRRCSAHWPPGRPLAGSSGAIPPGLLGELVASDHPFSLGRSPSAGQPTKRPSSDSNLASSSWWLGSTGRRHHRGRPGGRSYAERVHRVKRTQLVNK
jgi:hypothetical protein